MNMIHYEPYRLLNRAGDFNRLFADLLPGYEQEESAADYDWTPAVDLKEEDNRYLIHADVPGVKAENIDVSLEDGVLTIKGNRNYENQGTKDGYTRVERVHGDFYRRFNLPDTADMDKVSAQCKDGVLEIAIEKQHKVSAKKITVQG